MRKALLAFHIGVALAAATTTPATAQENQGSGFTLEEVVVTAQKRSESSQDVPISVQAFSSDSMEKLGVTQVQDLTLSAPSLSVGGPSGSNSLMGLRGVVDFSRNIGIDSRMGVYIDGVFQGRSSTANQPLLGLESVEILRGPQGTLFGKNTVSGAINLNTKKPSDQFTGELTAGFGNEGYWKGEAYLNGPLTESVLGSIAFSRQERDGYFDNRAIGDETGDWQQEGARGQLLFLPTEALEIIVAGDYGKTDSEIPFYARESDPAYTVFKQPESDDIEFWGSALTINYTTESDMVITSITAYRDNQYEAKIDEDWSPVTGWWTYFDEDSDQLSQEFRIVSAPQEKYDWVAGLYYFDSDVSTGRNIQFYEPFLAPQLPEALQPFAGAISGNVAIPSDIGITDYAAYVHGNYRFTQNLELTLGLRYTYEEKDLDWKQVNSPDNPAVAALLEQQTGVPFSQAPGVLFNAFNLEYKDDTDEDDWSPTIGLNYTPGDDILIYAKYSRGFKSGGWNADFRTSGLDSIAYDSESVDAYEIGLKSDLLDGHLRLNVTAFTQNYEDFQIFQRIPVGNTSVQELTNAGEATSQGVELETVWLPLDRLQLTLNATYLDATYDKFDNPVAEFDPTAPEDFEGNALSYAPDWRLYAGVQYIQPLGGLGDLTLNVDYSYQDESYSDPQAREVDYVPDYDLWNARLTYNPSSERWQVAAWVTNIGDDDYVTARSQASLTLVDRVMWGYPRFYGMSFTYYLGN